MSISQFAKSPERLSPADRLFSDDDTLLFTTALAVTWNTLKINPKTIENKFINMKKFYKDVGERCLQGAFTG